MEKRVEDIVNSRKKDLKGLFSDKIGSAAVVPTRPPPIGIGPDDATVSGIVQLSDTPNEREYKALATYEDIETLMHEMRDSMESVASTQAKIQVMLNKIKAV